MKIETTLRGSTAVVTLEGRMDADQAGLFEAACERAVAQGAAHLIVDVAHLSYVSSMGLRSFLQVAKSRQTAKATMAIVNFGGFVKQVFDVTRLTPLFQVYESVDQALQSIP